MPILWNTTHARPNRITGMLAAKFYKELPFYCLSEVFLVNQNISSFPVSLWNRLLFIPILPEAKTISTDVYLSKELFDALKKKFWAFMAVSFRHHAYVCAQSLSPVTRNAGRYAERATCPYAGQNDELRCLSNVCTPRQCLVEHLYGAQYQLPLSWQEIRYGRQFSIYARI